MKGLFEELIYALLMIFMKHEIDYFKDKNYVSYFFSSLKWIFQS